MAYASASDVAALTQNVINYEDNYTTSTSPTLSEVNVWLSSGCSIIETRLQAAGWSPPITVASRAYDWIKQLNTLYAVAMVEHSRTNVVTGPGERTRGQRFELMFWNGLNTFMDQDLTQLGVSRATTNTIFVGGISYSDKEAREADTDRVPSRIRRNMFGFPETVRPDRYNSGSGL